MDLGVEPLIDIRFVGSGVLAVYLVEGDEPALVDCGPASCVDALTDGLAERGLALTDVDHLLVTHIHPDHAGAAGVLLREHPKLQVHVSEIGAPHLVDPGRLERSARRLYGDDFDRLFEEIAPVPPENIRVLGDSVLDLEVLPTPGHASHQVAFLGGDGVCYPGDAVGCLIRPGHFLYPAAAPPEIDVEAWERSLDAIEERAPSVLRLPHFGEVADPPAHVARMRERLRAWSEQVRGGQSEEEFVAAADAQLAIEAPPVTIDLYRRLAFPTFAMSYAGLKRYWDKRDETSAP